MPPQNPTSVPDVDAFMEGRKQALDPDQFMQGRTAKKPAPLPRHKLAQGSQNLEDDKAVRHLVGQLAEGALPSTTAEDYLYPFTSPLQALKHLVTTMPKAIWEAHKELYEKGKRNQKNVTPAKDLAATALLGPLKGIATNPDATLAGVPILGPMLHSLLEQGVDDPSGALARGAGMYLGGKGTQKAMTGIGRFGSNPKPAVPPHVEAYLKGKGVRLTGGERSQPGFLRSAEPVMAQVATATGPVSKFLEARQKVLRNTIVDLKQQVLREVDAPPVERSTLGEQLQHRAVANLDAERRATTALKDSRAAEFSDSRPLGQADAGDIIIDTVRGQHELVDALERQLYGQFRTQLAQMEPAIAVAPTRPSTIFAGREYERFQKARKAGESPVIPDVETILRRVSGIDRIENVANEMFGAKFDTLPQSLQSEVMKFVTGDKLPVKDLLDARTGVQNTIRRMRRSGQFDNTSVGTLEHLNRLITRELRESLPPDLRAQWTAATSLTKQQKADFASQFMRSLMNEQNPIAAERVVKTLLQQGNETDVQSLLKIIGDDGRALATLRRAAIDHIQSAPTAERALKMLNQRPGMKHILGDGYSEFVRKLEQQMANETDTARTLYNTFLRRTLKVQEPETFIARALNSEGYAGRLEQLIPDRTMRAQVAQDMLTRLLDDPSVTRGGVFGASGAAFDPVAFAELWKKHRPTIYKFMPSEAYRALDEFAASAEYLKLSHALPQGNISAKWKTLQTVSAEVGIGKLLLAGQFLPAATIFGVIMTPRWLMQLSMSPRGAKLLSEGLRIPLDPRNAQYISWSYRVNQAMANMKATEFAGPHQPQVPPALESPQE